jgi:hypothetical protein
MGSGVGVGSVQISAKCARSPSMCRLCARQALRLPTTLRHSPSPHSLTPVSLATAACSLALTPSSRCRTVLACASYETKALPHLRAHATGLPYFRYLVSKPVHGFILGKEHAVPVMMPDPARFALHKLVVSTLRTASHALKADKDRRQAAVLIDALMEKFPEWLTVAVDELEGRARPRVAVAANRALNLVPGLSVRAQDFMADLAAQS